MPYIELHTNQSLSKETIDTLTSGFGIDIEYLPGKSADWLMCSFTCSQAMRFHGKDVPCCYLLIRVYGAFSKYNAGNLTCALTKRMVEHLNVDAEHVYITYENIAVWGWNGSNL